MLYGEIRDGMVACKQPALIPGLEPHAIDPATIAALSKAVDDDSALVRQACCAFQANAAELSGVP